MLTQFIIGKLGLMEEKQHIRRKTQVLPKNQQCACFGSTYTKIGTIQRRLARPLRKDDTQIREAFHIFVISLQLIKINEKNK